MKPGLVALSGFLTALAAFVADVMLLRFPVIRNGYWTYLPMAAGIALAVTALVKRRAWTTIVPGVLTVLLIGLYTLTRLMAAPDTPPAIDVADAFPDWSLPDHEGRTVRIQHEAQKGPLVVVLFRGSW
jgi:hypothetical protein